MNSSVLGLESGSRIAVIGGGPAGSFFSYFLTEIANRVGKDLSIDIYESRDFSRSGPSGCNMCGGIVSESLVQVLSTEGINLPSSVVQRGIDSYQLHTDVGSVRIETPLREMRIAAVYRGSGPRGVVMEKRGSETEGPDPETEGRYAETHAWISFDGYLQMLASERGARLVRGRVEEVNLKRGRPEIKTRDGSAQDYDLLAVAVGVNSITMKLFESSGLGGLDYRRPGTTRAFISEYYLGEETVASFFGTSMHVFLLNVPRLEFAAVIPKGGYATVCLLGRNVDTSLVKSFLNSREVRQCFPDNWQWEHSSCQCWPSISVRGAARPFADRIVFIGDCGITRLYKDGIGAAYRTAKAAATAAIFGGISASSFQKYYWPTCRRITRDNALGRLNFGIVRNIRKMPFARRAILRMCIAEQQEDPRRRRLSTVLWDMFTGSAPYKEIFLRTLNPAFLGRFLWNILVSIFSLRRAGQREEAAMNKGGLGRTYENGEIVFRQGGVGDSMYVVLEGQVEVFVETGGNEARLRVLGEGETVGEMAIFAREVRSASVRALGKARLLTVDKGNFLARVQQDPSLAFRILETMSRRIRELSDEVVTLKLTRC